MKKKCANQYSRVPHFFRSGVFEWTLNKVHFFWNCAVLLCSAKHFSSSKEVQHLFLLQKEGNVCNVCNEKFEGSKYESIGMRGAKMDVKRIQH